MGHLKNKEEENKSIIAQWADLYYHELYRWAKHKLTDIHLAEDLTQETFMAALKALNGFKAKSKPRTWLFQILNNKIVDHYRSKGKNISVSMEEYQLMDYTDGMFDGQNGWKEKGMNSFWSGTDSQAEELDMEQNLDNCMYSLPEAWRKVVFDKYYLDKKAEIICDENGLSKTNYWQIMHRMKLFLKDCLERIHKNKH